MCSSAFSRASTTTNLAATSKRTIFCSRLPHLVVPFSLPLLSNSNNPNSPNNLWVNLRIHTLDSSNLKACNLKVCNLNSPKLMVATECLLRVCPRLCLLKGTVSSQCRATASQWASQHKDGVNPWDSLCKATVSLWANQCRVMDSPCLASQCKATECLLSSSNNGACHPNKTLMAVSTNRSEQTNFRQLTGQVEA